ncbi:MAG: RNB domain-containing ribonuclease [Solirubrobacterales bacterium]
MSPRRGGALGRRVATIERRGRFAVAEPLFERGPQATLARGSVRVGPGELALVNFGPTGAKALRTLGSAERPSDVVAALLWDREGGRGFPPELEEEARDAATAASGDAPARRDLRDLATFTVDPATARDFDDAVSAAEDGDGVRLWIHIADVSAHVRPGGALDAEALRRGTSRYVPGTVEPMLPAVLSDDACSLAPGTERLAVTAEIALAADGGPRSASFYRSRIRSDARLSYEQLDELFAGRGDPPSEVGGPLALARRAAAALANRRSVGSLEIESFEPEFEFDADGAVVRAHSVQQTEAHQLIEHLMILTNERVAELLERRRVPTLYRVHEQPDPERIERLVEQLAALGVPTPPLPERASPAQAGALAGEVSRLVAREARRRGHGRDAYTSLVLRSLKPAYYSDRNLGHAGLGSPAYAHFTSPIRRYPDLIAHRGLLSAIGAGEPEPPGDQVRDAGWRSSEREREAMRVERDADKTCAAFLLDRELFQTGWSKSFEGEVSGLVGAGAFVRFGGELGDVYEGFLPARLLRGDRFDLNETETALVGRSSAGVLRLGDPVTVRVEAIDAPRGRVDLEPAGEPPTDAPRPRTRPKTRRPREARRRAEHRREGRDRPER